MGASGSGARLAAIGQKRSAANVPYEVSWRAVKPFAIEMLRSTLLLVVGAFLALTAARCQASATENRADQITVELQERLRVPAAKSDGSASLLVFTRVAWSPVTNQIAAAPFLSSSNFIVDPDTGSATVFDAGFSSPEESTLMWSSHRPWLVISNSSYVRVFDTSKSPAEKPALVRNLDNPLPHPLVAQGAALVEEGDDEWVTLVGSTNHKIYSHNPEITARSITTGERRLAWQFPKDGDSYYFHTSPTAGLVDGDVAIVSWVMHYDVVHPEPKGTASWDEMWLLKPGRESAGCKLRPRPRFVPGGSNSMIVGSGQNPSISSDGRWFAYDWSEYRTAVHVRNAVDCSVVADLFVGDGPLPSYLTFSPDGRWLLGTAPMHLGRQEGRLYLWRTSDWVLVHQSVTPSLYQASFNKDGTRFVVGTVGGLYVYRITTPPSTHVGALR
jgi:hypothetical protein